MTPTYTTAPLFTERPTDPPLVQSAPRFAADQRVRMHNLQMVWRVVARKRELDEWMYAVTIDSLAGAVEAEGGVPREVGWYYEHELESVT